MEKEARRNDLVVRQRNGVPCVCSVEPDGGGFRYNVVKKFKTEDEALAFVRKKNPDVPTENKKKNR